MPVFFFIDPEFEKDPFLTNVDSIILSYTFFKTGDEKVEEPIEPQKKLIVAEVSSNPAIIIPK